MTTLPSETIEVSTLTGGEKAKATLQAKFQDKRDRLAELYLSGKTFQEIADILGTTKSTVIVAVNRLRTYGYDLPHRRPADVVERAAAATHRARWEAGR